mmetsp:Transcript_9866/g.26790  ORF Transcript_9866/g.26790 Transcript_9866/m.26790 type:complete len:401 (-) Transcript_9866:626-1828(-)
MFHARPRRGHLRFSADDLLACRRRRISGCVGRRAFLAHPAHVRDERHLRNDCSWRHLAHDADEGGPGTLLGHDRDRRLLREHLWRLHGLAAHAQPLQEEGRQGLHGDDASSRLCLPRRGIDAPRASESHQHRVGAALCRCHWRPRVHVVGQRRLQVRHARRCRCVAGHTCEHQSRRPRDFVFAARCVRPPGPHHGCKGQPHCAAADGGRLPLARGLGCHGHVHRLLLGRACGWRQNGEHLRGARRFCRWRDPDRQHHRLRQAEWEPLVQGAQPSGQELPEPLRLDRLLRAHGRLPPAGRWNVRRGAALRRGGACLPDGLAPRRQRRRWRHARVHHGAELLLRLGLGRGGLPLEEHRLDHCGLAHRLQRSDPDEDHVRRHEPRHLQRSLRRHQQCACCQGR